MSAEFKWTFPLQTFIDAVQRKEARCLYRAGRAMLRKYKRVLGKPYPKEKTPKGKRSSRYMKEVVSGNRSPYPYMKTGVLKNATEFAVDMDEGTVYAGPIKLSGHGWGTRVKSNKPTPQLLEEGGGAQVLTAVRIKNVRSGRQTRTKRTGGKWINVEYRSFAYKSVAKEQGVKELASTLAQVPL